MFSTGIWSQGLHRCSYNFYLTASGNGKFIFKSSLPHFLNFWVQIVRNFFLIQSQYLFPALLPSCDSTHWSRLQSAYGGVFKGKDERLAPSHLEVSHSDHSCNLEVIKNPYFSQNWYWSKLHYCLSSKPRCIRFLVLVHSYEYLYFGSEIRCNVRQLKIKDKTLTLICGLSTGEKWFFCCC